MKAPGGQDKDRQDQAEVTPLDRLRQTPGDHRKSQKQDADRRGGSQGGDPLQTDGTGALPRDLWSADWMGADPLVSSSLNRLLTGVEDRGHTVHLFHELVLSALL
jgi:hypothetical protein